MAAPRLKPVEDQVIVVTGATSGIGLATVRMAAERGAAVVAAARNEEALGQLAEEIRGQGGRIETVVADVSDMDRVEAIGEAALRAFGRIDSWCNNAAVSIYGELEEVPLEEQRRLFDVNYWGVVHGTLVAARHLKGRGGAIVNVGSVLSERAMALQGTYSATKFAVKAVTDSFRMEFEEQGYPISVTLIKPGPIDTPYMEHARNRLGTPGTKNPPPAYHPRLVGRAILHACETRIRDITVGGGGLVIAAMGKVAPRLTDLFMSLTARSSQSSEEPGRPERRDNLYEPREDMAETSSLSGPPPRRTSLLLEAQINPLGSAGLALGLSALLVGAYFGMASLRRERSLPERLTDRARRLGRDVARDAERGASGLLGEVNRLAHRAMDYAEQAERAARPYVRQAGREASRYADRAGRYAADTAEAARERGEELYEEGRERGWSLFGRARDRGDEIYDDARERGWSLFGRARDRAEDEYHRARRAGRRGYRDARDEGWSLFGRARREGRRAGDRASAEGANFLDRLGEALRRRL